MATLINFDKALGPSFPTGWVPRPPPWPRPNFDRVLADRPDEN